MSPWVQLRHFRHLQQFYCTLILQSARCSHMRSVSGARSNRSLLFWAQSDPSGANRIAGGLFRTKYSASTRPTRISWSVTRVDILMLYLVRRWGVTYRFALGNVSLWSLRFSNMQSAILLRSPSRFNMVLSLHDIHCGRTSTTLLSHFDICKLSPGQKIEIMIFQMTCHSSSRVLLLNHLWCFLVNPVNNHYAKICDSYTNKKCNYLFDHFHFSWQLRMSDRITVYIWSTVKYFLPRSRSCSTNCRSISKASSFPAWYSLSVVCTVIE